MEPVLVYVAEIAPKNLQGRLATTNQAEVSHKKEFQLALSRLQGKDVDISDEAAKILELSKLS
ncbi:hypothetical protein JHK84_052148 [Glycine max]|nr:hypothetical protein JHK85_052954 [Glycine max]KAG5082110.1 hypothetical protein JHK84_052148 [Glycine max]